MAESFYSSDLSDEETDSEEFSSNTNKSDVWQYFRKLDNGEEAICLNPLCKGKKPLQCKGGSTNGLRQQQIRIHGVNFVKSKKKLVFDSYQTTVIATDLSLI